MAGNDVFGMLSEDDKLDGTNYPLWSYMMRHVLVAKGFWNVVNGREARPTLPLVEQVGSDADTGEATGSGGSVDILGVPPTVEQTRWDGRDANAHALIALSVKHGIILHIRLCKTAKEAWDALASLNHVRNEARVAYLRTQLESKHMNEGDSMDEFLTKIKDFREQLASLDEVYPDSSLVPTVLNALPDTYQSFASTIRLMMKGNPNALTFDELVSVLLQEEQSRQNRTVMRIGDQAFAASQRGKGK
ncbi:hypothetical protein, partial [Myroides marinus]|uniref:hypothetical protein n=1 Tax=Myroides marinus TaxID=703342 RepID=UPI002576AF10